MKMDRLLSEQTWHTLYQHTTDPKSLRFLFNSNDKSYFLATFMNTVYMFGYEKKKYEDTKVGHQKP